jgi:predicted nucleic acid-binding protein
VIRRAVLADTGPLYAAVDPSDQYHGRAGDELQRLSDAGFTVAIAWPILAEAYTLVLRRLGARTAFTFLRESITTGVPLNPDPGDYGAAVQRLTARWSRVTLFDAVLAELSDRLDVPVWTYDRDFHAMGVAVWR